MFLIIADADYEPLPIILNFTESSKISEVPLSITNDDVLENNEEFTASLGLMDLKYDGHVILQPNVSMVTILDNDS